MSKEKQIEEITKILDSNCEGIPDTVCQENSCSSCKAKQIIGVVYRKQSVGEWISVEERLPEDETPVLVFTEKGSFYVGYYYKAVTNPCFTGFYADSCKRNVTHWMPLPEPPKGE